MGDRLAVSCSSDKQRKLSEKPLRATSVVSRTSVKRPSSAPHTQTKLPFSSQSTKSEVSAAAPGGLKVFQPKPPKAFSSISNVATKPVPKKSVKALKPISLSGPVEAPQASSSKSKLDQPHHEPMLPPKRKQGRGSDLNLTAKRPKKNDLPLFQRRNQPSSEPDAIPGMSQLSQLPFRSHIDNLPGFLDKHKSIYCLEETPAYARWPQPDTTTTPLHNPTEPQLAFALDRSLSPPCMSDRAIREGAGTGLSDEESVEAKHTSSRGLHQVQIGPDDSGIALEDHSPTSKRPRSSVLSPPPLTQISLDSDSPPVGYYSIPSSSAASSRQTSNSYDESLYYYAAAAAKPMCSPEQQHRSLYPPQRPPFTGSKSSPETSSSPAHRPLARTASNSPVLHRSQPVGMSSSATESSSPTRGSPTVREQEHMRILCNNTPTHLRRRHLSPGALEPLPDTFYRGMEETFPAHNPFRGCTSQEKDPFMNLESKPLEQSPRWRSGFESEDRTPPISANSFEDSFVPETPNVSMPKQPQSHTRPSVGGFNSILDAWAGCQQEQQMPERNAWTQSSLDGFVTKAKSKSTRLKEEEDALTAISRHIQSEQMRKRRLDEASDVLLSSQTQPAFNSLLRSQAQDDADDEADIIPETLPSVSL